MSAARRSETAGSNKEWTLHRERNVCFCRLAPPFFAHLHPTSSTWSPHYATALYNTASYPDNWAPLPGRLCLHAKAVLGFALSPVAVCDLNVNEEADPAVEQARH